MQQRTIFYEYVRRCVIRAPFTAPEVVYLCIFHKNQLTRFIARSLRPVFTQVANVMIHFECRISHISAKYNSVGVTNISRHI